jgi:5-methylcytosine-specific restriction enzyme subunit McrC
MQIIKMVEGDLMRIPPSGLEESVALKIHREHGHQIHIDFPTLLNENHYALRSRGYVGQLALSNKIHLQIQPKIPLTNLFGLIEYGYRLNALQLLEKHTPLETLSEVFEFLAAILAKKVRDRAQRGLLRDYVEREGELPYLRGRFIPETSFKNGIKRRLTVGCRFHHHTTNVLDNRILAWTLCCLRNLPLQRLEVKQLVHQAFRLVSGAVELNYVGPEECLDRVYHRLNQDYRSMHALCRFFLENSGPQLGGGKREFMSLLVHMPALFEVFVAEWLKAHLGGEYALISQYRVSLKGSETLAFRIDMVLSEVGSGRVLAVLDTKYKRGEAPDEADIQQVVAYAVRMETSRAFLVYPSQTTRPLALQVGNVQVGTLVFDLGGDLKESGTIFIRQLLQRIELEESL